MDLMEQGITWLQHLPPLGVLGLMFFVAYIENVFPPSPSDVLLVFAGTLIGLGTIGFVPALLAATAGSTLGFMTAYGVGRYFENHVIEGRLGKFLPVGTIMQVERLFQRFGYAVIVANRFLAGTRGIVSFFAGMSKMNLTVTTGLCAVGALAWNAILLSLGKLFGGNWRLAVGYIVIYSKWATIIFGAAMAAAVCVYLRKRRNAALNLPPPTSNP
jgi:membrane protein DedA with SNARE-associated domain